MKLYIAALVLCVSSVSFAAPDSVHVGETTGKFDQRDCSAPEITECEPCIRQCKQHNLDAREAMSKLNLKGGSATAKKANVSSGRKE